MAHFLVYKAASSAFSHGTLPVGSTVPLSLMRLSETQSLSDLPKVTQVVVGRGVRAQTQAGSASPTPRTTLVTSSDWCFTWELTHLKKKKKSLYLVQSDLF